MRAVLSLAVAVPCLFLSASSSSWAGEIVAVSRIDAVTVYPDAASVTRTAEVALPEGSTRVLFEALPLTIDPDSLRVEAKGPGKLTIGAVESRIAPAKPAPADNDLDARIKSLKAQRETAQVTIDALEGKKAMILRLSRAPLEEASLEKRPLDVAQWEAAWDKVGKALLSVGEELSAARAKARDLDEEIKGLEASRQRPAPKTGPAREVSVAMAAEGATQAVINLTYRVVEASWRPVYDARLDTGGAGRKPSLDLLRRAAITQRTGEDWNDVALSVSTTRIDRGTAPPDIQPVKLIFAEELPEMALPAGAPLRSKKAKPPPAQAEAAAPAVAPPPPEPAKEQQASLDSGPYSAAFEVPGRVSIPSDGTQKSFLLAAQTLDPAILVRAVPALDATAYIDAHLTNEGEVPLLPGEVALLRDGTYVGSGRVALVAPGDGFDLGFGADERVKVARVPVKRKENDPYWVGSNKTESNEFKTTVKNLHDFAVKVSVIDQIPISETTTIVIEQLPATTPPTEKTIGDKRGVMGWTFDLQPNETKEIRLAYRMKWPADRAVAYEAAPVSPH